MKQYSLVLLVALSVVSGWSLIIRESGSGEHHIIRILSDEKAALIHGWGPYWPCQWRALEEPCEVDDPNACPNKFPNCNNEGNPCRGLCSVSGGPRHSRCTGSASGLMFCEDKVNPDGCGNIMWPRECTFIDLPPSCMCIGNTTTVPCPQRFADLTGDLCYGV
jgi:hypothetical protein